MTGFSAKNSNQSSSETEASDNQENSDITSGNLSTELNKLNELLKSGALTQEEFEQAKKKILDN